MNKHMSFDDSLNDGLGVERYKPDTVNVTFWYPRQRTIRYLELGLCDVRASDGIRVHYDFDRDGYVIEQPTQLSWTPDEVPDEKWKEVAFIESWALEAEQQRNEPA